jgi:hypothetical protein
VATLFIGVLSVAQSWAAQPLDQLLACRHVPDSAARLDCFDRASDAALAVKAPQAGVAPSERATVESSIAQISQPLMGRADFTLENGQVWRQMDAEDAKSAKIGDRVVVSKKVVGAYWLKVEGGRAWRVTLVRTDKGLHDP